MNFSKYLNTAKTVSKQKFILKTVPKELFLNFNKYLHDKVIKACIKAGDLKEMFNILERSSTFNLSISVILKLKTCCKVG